MKLKNGDGAWKFYRLDDQRANGIWLLDTEDDEKRVALRLRVMRCEPVEVVGTVVLHQVGQLRPAVDFALPVLGLPVVSPAARAVLELVAGNHLQFIPARVRGSSGDYYVMNILRLVDAFDHGASSFSYYKRPEDFRLVTPVIDAAKVGGIPILRLRGATRTIVVTADVATALRSSGLSGCELLPLGATE